MKKIQNILTAVIIIAVVGLMGIIVWIGYNQIINLQKEENTTNTITTNETNTTNNTVVEEDKEEESTPIESNDDYIGIEEEESNQEENIEKSTDEKAIDLAKETWGEDTSVTFSIERKDGNVYYIAVRSNATTISWYQVNIDTWEINEYY